MSKRDSQVSDDAVKGTDALFRASSEKEEEVDQHDWSTQSLDEVHEVCPEKQRHESDLTLDKKPLEQDVEKAKSRNTLARTLSKRSTASSWADPGPPPEGGLQAWLQVVALHLTVFSTWGWITSFGVFQSYYATTLELTPSAISWLGSVQVFLLFFLGTFTGRALDAGLFRIVYTAGTVFQLLGVFTTSVSTQYWQLFLSQALATGISNGLQFCPAMALISTYFVRKRPFVLGLGALGSCTGGIVFPIIVQQLLPRIGFGWTIRICGFIMLLTNAVTLLLYRTRLPPRKAGAIVEWSAFRELPYTLYIVGMFFNFWGLYFAFYFVGAYGRNILDMSYSASINLLLSMVAIGFPFRVGPNFFAIYTGPVNILIPCTLLCGVMMFGWIGVRSVGSLFVFAVLYGAGSAGLQGMFPPGLASLTDDITRTGVRMGMGFTVVSFACLSGPPIAGALIQAHGGDYLYAQVWAGASFMLGTGFLVAARAVKVGWHLKRKI